MSQERARPDANNCFVCGPDNPIGLHLTFRMDGTICRSEFIPDQRHVGFDGMTHGGILYSVLDDAMANWLFLQGARGYTARCEVRYLEPLDIGVEVHLEGRLERRKARLAKLVARAVRANDGKTVAQAQASFMIESPGQLL
ncbi:uncharacterized protein METZ01_LOCUS253085 [marine metagenome]|uniref:Thioesterase domain-containing protein n=1 Tax=marine metagenome TaxID=408172 RepID=A0A382INH0_9ZZZZ